MRLVKNQDAFVSILSIFILIDLEDRKIRILVDLSGVGVAIVPEH